MKKLCFLLTMLMLALPTSDCALANDRQASLTLMIYVTGSDLESSAGAATSDIIEMLASGVDTDQVNVLLCTGGSQSWQMGLPNDRICFSCIRKGHLLMLESLELESMGDPDTLAAFLNYSRNRCPADSYALILWDHGAGPMNGVCFDELFRGSGSPDSLDLNELETALRKSSFGGDNRLEWIGFDACLMSSLEVAMACAPYARYMIASQETEPGSGWNYSFLAGAAECLDGDAMGRAIIDSYFEGSEQSPQLMTLACIDLDQAETVSRAMDDLFSVLGGEMDADSFSVISNARLKARDFGRAVTGSDYDLVDLYSLASQYDGIAQEEAEAVKAALDGAVIACRGNVQDSHGLSIYHPYYNKEYFTLRWGENYAQFDFAPGYNDYLQSYAELWLGDQMADWTDIKAEALAPKAEAQELTLALTEEQMANFGYAEVYILCGGMFDNGDYYEKINEITDVSMDDRGVLHAFYNYRTLCVFDEGGNPLTDFVQYYLIDDTYLIRANMTEKTYEQFQSDLWTMSNDDFIASDAYLKKVYLQFRQFDGDDRLTYSGLLDLTSEFGQGYAGFLREGSQLLQNDVLRQGRTPFSLKDENCEWVWVLSYPREKTRDEDGRILPFAAWRSPSDTAGIIAFHMNEINNREPWSLAFVDRQFTGRSYWAQFVIHDVQGNAFGSELIPVSNPNLSGSTDIQNVIAGSNGWSATLKDIEVINAVSDAGLYVHFDLICPAGAEDVSQLCAGDVMLNDCRLPAQDCDLSSAAGEGVLQCTLTIPADKIAILPESTLERLQFDLFASPAEFYAQNAFLSIDWTGETDISAFHEAFLSASEPLAESVAGGLTVRLLSLEEDEAGDVHFSLFMRNDRTVDADISFSADSLVNGCEWLYSVMGTKDQLLRPNEWTIAEATLRRKLNMDETTMSILGIMPVDPAAYWNTDRIESITLSLYDDVDFTLELKEPCSLSSVSAEDAPPRVGLLDADGLQINLRAIAIQGDQLRLRMDIVNASGKAVSLVQQDGSTVNGRPLTVWWNGEGRYFMPHHPLPDGRSVRTYAAVELSALENEPIETLSFCFGGEDENGQEMFFSPFVLGFAGGMTAEQLAEMDIASGALSVTPAEALSSEARDPTTLIDPDIAVPENAALCAAAYNVQLTPQQAEDFKDASLLLMLQEDEMYYHGTYWPAVTLDESNNLRAEICGLCLCMEGDDKPLIQSIISTEDGGQLFRLRGFSCWTDSALKNEKRINSADVLYDPVSNSACLTDVEVEGSLSTGEKIMQCILYRVAYRITDGDVPLLERTDPYGMSGRTCYPDGDAIRLGLRPISNFPCRILFQIETKDGEFYVLDAVPDDQP